MSTLLMLGARRYARKCSPNNRRGLRVYSTSKRFMLFVQDMISY